MTAMTVNMSPTEKRRWLKRAGAIGFWFFMIKGLLWLAAPFVFYLYI